MTPSERIETLLRMTGLSAAALSRLAGYKKPQALYDICRGRTRNISHEVADRLLQVLPGISRAWLLTGEGDIGNVTTVHGDIQFGHRGNNAVNGSDNAFRKATVSVTNNYREGEQSLDQLYQSLNLLQQELSLFRREHAKLIDIIAKLSSTDDK